MLQKQEIHQISCVNKEYQLSDLLTKTGKNILPIINTINSGILNNWK